jgi:5-methylcytosine-specific restriction protein A
MPYISKGIGSIIHKAKLYRKPSGEQGNYNNAWQQVSKNYRRANPLCECCLVLGVMTDITPGDYKGCVDHMIPITRGGSMYNLNNLLALCKSCHDTKSIHEKTSIAPVAIQLDADAKYIPADKGKVIAWLADKVRRKEQGREGETTGQGQNLG